MTSPRTLQLVSILLLLVPAFSSCSTDVASADPMGERASGDVVPAFQARLAALAERAQSEPAGSPSQLELARLLHDAHRHEEAVARLSTYLEAQPDDRQAWLDLANMLAALDRWGEAETASRALLERYPGDPAALYNLGAIAANRGRDDEARSLWRALLDDAGSDPLALLAAESLSRLDAPVESASAPQGGRALPPGHPPVQVSPISSGRRPLEYLQAWPRPQPR